jgi:hypothetical protein
VHRRPGTREGDGLSSAPLLQRSPARRAGRSDCSDVLGLIALTTGADLELDLLTLFEGAVARPLDLREVDEQVAVRIVTADEAVTLLGVEELDGSRRPN